MAPIKEQEKIKDECDDLANSFTKIRINESFQRSKNARDDLIANMRNITLCNV